jgi:2-phospho-L-lactate guanylyltransferase
MNFQILIPAKPLTKGKSRLAPVLSGARRAVICERFLRRTLALGTATAPTTVVTADPRVAAIAGSAGAQALLEPVDCGLNGALDWARGQAGNNIDCLLVMPTDLPWLSLAGLRSLCTSRRQIAIIADRRGKGTNLLFLPREAIRDFRFAFGQDSAAAHRAEAARLGMPTETIRFAEAEFDIDLPEDYAEYLSRRALNDDFPDPAGVDPDIGLGREGTIFSTRETRRVARSH